MDRIVTPMRRVPHINDKAFPEPDRQHVDSILLLMGDLNGFIDQFRSALQLFDHAHDLKRYDWAGIARRDAVFSVHEFGKAISALRSALSQCQSLRTTERTRALASANGRFGAAFKDIGKVRQFSAHPTSQIGDPQARKRHSKDGIMVSGGMRDRVIECTYDGQFAVLDFTEETAEKLEVVRDAVFGVFVDSHG